MRQGVIDIGSNSVKLLIADCIDGQIHPVEETSCQTRLGQGLYEYSELQPKSIERTVESVRFFIRLAESKNVEKISVLATSAVREARNANQLISAIDKPVSILSGADEAQFSFAGVMTSSHLSKSNLLVVDAGGGSTEFTSGNITGVDRHISISLGSVRLMESFPASDNPTFEQLKALRNTIDSKLQNIISSDDWKSKPNMFLVGVGGIATIFAMMELSIEDFDRTRIEQVALSAEQVVCWSEKLWGLSLTERQKINGLPANRADVALYGCIIYERILLGLHYNKIFISTRGIRFGALVENF